MVLAGVVQAFRRLLLASGFTCVFRFTPDLSRGLRLLRCLDSNQVDHSFYHSAGHGIIFLDNLVANSAKSERFECSALGRFGADSAPDLCDA